MTWPPPGLEKLHGMLATVARRGLLATLLAGPALLWLTTSRRVADGGPGGLTGLILTIGLLAYLGTIMRAAAALDFARQGRRLGYSRGLLLDVLADRSTDTPSLVAGSGIFEDVRPRVRETMRRLRRTSAVLAAGAGLLPLPLLALGVWLALRGAASVLSVWLLLVAPALILGIAALVLRGYAALLGQWELGAAAWDPSPVTLTDRVGEWRAAFDTSPAPTRPGGLGAVVLLAATGIFCFVFVVVTTAGMGALVSWTAEGARYGSDFDLSRLARAEAMRPLRRAPDPLAREHADSAARRYLEAASDPVNGLWPDPALPPPPSPGFTWRMLLADEPPLRAQAWLGLPPHPALAELHLLAGADSIEPAALDGAPADMGYGDAAVQRPIIDAANALRAGRRAQAEDILRDLLSAGLLLMDNARMLPQLRLGGEMALAGGSLLREISPPGAAMAQADSAVLRSWRRAAGTTSPVVTARFDLMRQARDPNRYPALRWDAARQLFLRESCGSPGALLFGARANGWQKGVTGALVRSPADSVAWQQLTSALDHDPQPRSWRGRRVLRAARWIGGEHLVRTPCMAALLHAL